MHPVSIVSPGQATVAKGMERAARYRVALPAVTGSRINRA